MCISNYRWENDWLVCNRCGQKIGFRYTDSFKLALDMNTGQVVYKIKVFLNYPYCNLINKESIKLD